MSPSNHTYQVTLSDMPLSHICQRRECRATAQGHVIIVLDDAAAAQYDLCFSHMREIVTGCVDVLEV